MTRWLLFLASVFVPPLDARSEVGSHLRHFFFFSGAEFVYHYSWCGKQPNSTWFDWMHDGRQGPLVQGTPAGCELNMVRGNRGIMVPWTMQQKTLQILQWAARQGFTEIFVTLPDADAGGLIPGPALDWLRRNEQLIAGFYGPDEYLWNHESDPKTKTFTGRNTTARAALRRNLQLVREEFPRVPILMTLAWVSLSEESKLEYVAAFVADLLDATATAPLVDWWGFDRYLSEASPNWDSVVEGWNEWLSIAQRLDRLLDRLEATYARYMPRVYVIPALWYRDAIPSVDPRTAAGLVPPKAVVSRTETSRCVSNRVFDGMVISYALNNPRAIAVVPFLLDLAMVEMAGVQAVRASADFQYLASVAQAIASQDWSGHVFCPYGSYGEAGSTSRNLWGLALNCTVGTCDQYFVPPAGHGSLDHCTGREWRGGAWQPAGGLCCETVGALPT